MAGQEGFRPVLAASTSVLGVPVHIVDMNQVVRLMEEWIERRERRWIAETGSHGIMEGFKHPDFRAILRSADLSIPDGHWAAQVAGKRAACTPKRVRGVEMMLAFCAVAEKKGYSSFFFGDTEEVLEQLARNLLARFPALKIAGTYSPPFRPLSSAEDTEIIRLINEANPDVLWVSLGLPKQERWIHAHRSRLNAPVTVAAGANFKFVSGNVASAPASVTGRGFEWLWRFVHEPQKLWRRVVVYGPQFVVHTLLELSGVRKYD